MTQATFAAGCFWSTEAAFRLIPGVRSTEVGYAGGHIRNVTAAQVQAGVTGHAETVRIHFDPAEVTYEELLDAFWALHDPTQSDGQGPFFGPQYRSLIFVHDEEQEQAAILSRTRLEQSRRHERPVVTRILPAGDFWRAEEWQQQYIERFVLSRACRA